MDRPTFIDGELRHYEDLIEKGRAREGGVLIQTYVVALRYIKFLEGKLADFKNIPSEPLAPVPPASAKKKK